MCQPKKCSFQVKKGNLSPSLGFSAQGSAQVAQGLLRKIILVAIVLSGFSCSVPIREGELAQSRADAVLPSGRSVFIFDFAKSRYQKWLLPDGSPTNSCRLLDTIHGNWAAPSNWFALASPLKPFLPMQAIWGPNGDFFLLDRAGSRLALYDSNAQYLSGFSLPAEIKTRNLPSFEVFWTRDGLFSFVDLGQGKVWQYAEVRLAGGLGDWQLRNTVRLSLGFLSCVWEPYFRQPSCLDKKGQWTAFDSYFNPAGNKMKASSVDGIEPGVATENNAWNLIIHGNHQCVSQSPMIYLKESGLFAPINPNSKTLPETGKKPSQL